MGTGGQPRLAPIRIARHRPHPLHTPAPWHPSDKTEPLTPGQVEEFAIEILPAAWVFKKGHRIRIDISNADSAASDAPWTHHYGTRMGTDTYHHDQPRPSRLMLPIPPADAWIGEPTPPRPSGAPTDNTTAS